MVLICLNQASFANSSYTTLISQVHVDVSSAILYNEINNELMIFPVTLEKKEKMNVMHDWFLAEFAMLKVFIWLLDLLKKS